MLPLTIKPRLFLMLLAGFFGFAFLGILVVDGIIYMQAQAYGLSIRFSGLDFFVPCNKPNQGYDDFILSTGISISGFVIVVGSLGLWLLFKRRQSYHSAEALSVGQWVPVFMALFWLQRIGVLLYILMGYFFQKRWLCSGPVSKYLHLPPCVFTILMSIPAFAVVALVLFYFVPPKQRLTLVSAGFASAMMIGLAYFLL